MAYRHIVIRNPSKLSTRDEQLVIKQEETFRIPLEDIATITLEDPAISISSALLSKCIEYHVEIIVCDKKWLPSGILQPFHQHSRQKVVLETQLGLSKPFKKRIWQQIVIRKIVNQARCLEILNKVEEARKIYAISRNVESGDGTNREAYAAKMYFELLFGPHFIRRDENVKNIALNYGYSIMRSLVARSLVRYGFSPSIGIFHDSQTNAFNLADDFMEVLRPFIDVTVAIHVTEDQEWCSQLREKLLAVLNVEAVWKGARLSITNGVDQMVKSFVSACRQQDSSLLILPELINLNNHSYE